MTDSAALPADHHAPGHACGPHCPHHGGAPLPDPRSVDDHLGYRREARARQFPILGALMERVLIYDGGFGTQLFAYDLNPGDLGSGATDGCVELVHRTRPEIAPAIHRAYFAAGADVVETHSFNALPHALAEFGIADQAEDLALLAARAACGERDAASTRDRPRFVAGALGSGTKMPSIGAIGWDPLFSSYRIAARGLLRGGVDLILIETAQDILQVKAAVLGARAAMAEVGREVPIQAQVTFEADNTRTKAQYTLTGTDVTGVLTALEALPIDILGINCATGPDLIDPNIRAMAEQATRWVSCLPNAGLPKNVGGKAVYDLTPEELVRWHRKFVKDYGVNLVGGCCGTTPAHIAAVVEALHGAAPGARRRDRFPAQLSNLTGPAVPLRQDAGVLVIGERTNATGSKAFRERLFAGDLDGMTEMAHEQVAEGAHVLDVSVAWTGRDERAEMGWTLDRFAKLIPIPIMVDSTQLDVMEAALQRLGGRAIVNSVNLEDGEEKLDKVCALAKRYGAALVALTIDEDKAAGMAKSVERKVEIATRLHRLITERHGIPASSILFDLLTFPITQGDEDTRKLGLWTLEGIAAVKARFPECGFVLGLSNISFGVKPYARQVLNSVYLDEAIQRGLTAAIMNASKILPLNRIPEAELRLARDLIYDRRTFAADGSVAHDPLFAFVDHFTNAQGAATGPAADPFAGLTTPERLKRRIIDGKKVGIDADLDTAMREGLTPLRIINDHLLDGMKVVGELFGSGKMQLPFVLQSAETMKAAVRHLEPHMEKTGGVSKGVMVLATVRGDVHDIGKNLVDIILTNNGYIVINLGIKQTIEEILAACDRHRPDAIGMSGLLVKSTVVMKENLQYLAERRLPYQVILGGAALNRAYVENDLRAVYHHGVVDGPGQVRSGADAPAHRVWYASDAFDGLQFMEELCGHVTGDARRLTTKAARVATVKTAHQLLEEKLEAGRAYVPSTVGPAPAIPQPPFWGRRLVRADQLDLPTICSYINPDALFRGQWGFRQGQELTRAQWQELVDREAVPVLRRWIATATAERMLDPAVAYGYWPCASERNDLVVFDPGHGGEVARFNLPRQMGERSSHLCISDFLRPRGAPPIGGEAGFIPAAAWANGARDVIAFHVVTMGAIASQHCQRLFKADNYQEYLYFYGLSVESAEALAEYWHQRIRQELGIAGADSPELAKLFTQGYQGSRYSFGYPACPRLDDQRHLQALLGWQDLGIELSEEFQLHPEQSTSAMILHHPDARYFNL